MNTTLNRLVDRSEILDAGNKKNSEGQINRVIQGAHKNTAAAARVEAGLKLWAMKSAKHAAKQATLSTTVITLAACGGGGNSDDDAAATQSGDTSIGGVIKISDVATLSEAQSLVTVQGVATGATINVADITSDVFDPVTVLATGIDANGDTLTFDFVDENDLVILSADSEITSFSVIQVVRGTVDFTDLPEGMLNGVILELGSGAIVTVEQFLKLNAVQLRDKAIAGKLEIDLSNLDNDKFVELMDKLAKIEDIEFSAGNSSKLSAEQLEQLLGANVTVPEGDDATVGMDVDEGKAITEDEEDETVLANSNDDEAVAETDASDPIVEDGEDGLEITATPIQASIRLQGMEGLLHDRFPQVTALQDDGFVVTWQGQTSDGQGYDIFVQQFNSNGLKEGPLNRVQGNTDGLMDQLPKVSTLTDGGFVIVWHGNSTFSQEWDIFVQQFDNLGKKSEEPIRLQGFSKDIDGERVTGMLRDEAPQISALSDGGFVVTWEGMTSDGQATDIFVQKFDYKGEISGEMSRLQGMSGKLDDVSPQISALSGGGFVVTWEGMTSDGQGKDIFVQKFNTKGEPSGEMSRLQGMFGNLLDWQPQVSALINGQYVVTWIGNTSDGQGWDVFVQQFESNGEPAGNVARLRGMSGDLRDYSPQITELTGGGFVIIWQGETSDNQGFDIFLQRFKSDMLRDGDLIRLKGMEGDLGDWYPQISALENGGFVVTWSGETSDGQNYDIFKQQFDETGGLVNPEVPNSSIMDGDIESVPTRLQGMAGDLEDWAPQVTELSGGRYVLTWHGDTSDGQKSDIFIQLFNGDGNPMDFNHIDPRPETQEFSLLDGYNEADFSPLTSSSDIII